MARPCTQRRVADHLEGRVYKPAGTPLGDLVSATLPLDGLEALRLADMVGLYHEAAAVRMGVSRQTFERILEAARRTVAGALVAGRVLCIGGGAFLRCADRQGPCPVHGDRRRGRRCGCRRSGRHGWSGGDAGKEADMPRGDGTGPRGRGCEQGRGGRRWRGGRGAQEGAGPGAAGAPTGGAAGQGGGRRRMRRRMRGGAGPQGPSNPGGAS